MNSELQSRNLEMKEMQEEEHNMYNNMIEHPQSHFDVETPIPGVTIFRNAFSQGNLRQMLREWENHPPSFAYHRFSCERGTYFSPKMSLVISYTNDEIYNYSTSVTYVTVPPSDLPNTSKLFRELCSSFSFKPDHAHVVLYPDENNSINWHTDNPIQPGSSVLALRLGCPRIISLCKPDFPQNVIKFTVYEGDVWIMDWDAQNIWEHAVLPITKEKINQLLQNRPKPVFAINSYTSGAIVGRIPHIAKQKHIFTGNEQLLIPNANLKQLLSYQIPSSNSNLGPPFVHFTMTPYFGMVQLPIGSIHTSAFLFSEKFHTNQQSALVSNDNIASSLIFGEQDTFNACIRLWDSNCNKIYENAMQNAGFLSSAIRVFVNLQNCKHTLNIKSTNALNILNWDLESNTEDNSVEFTNNPKCMLYVGMMFVTSFIYKDSRIIFQLAENPAPKSWREFVFHSNNLQIINH